MSEAHTIDFLRLLLAMKRLECPGELGWLTLAESPVEVSKRDWFVRPRLTTRGPIERVLEESGAIGLAGTPGWLGRPRAKGKLYFDQSKLFGYLLSEAAP